MSSRYTDCQKGKHPKIVNIRERYSKYVPTDFVELFFVWESAALGTQVFHYLQLKSNQCLNCGNWRTWEMLFTRNLNPFFLEIPALFYFNDGAIVL